MKLTTSVRQKLETLFQDAELLDTICANVASGSDLVTLCKGWEVPYGAVCNWIRKDTERNKRYESAIADRKEFSVDEILRELRFLRISDIRVLFNPDGSMKPVADWPEDVAKAVASVEIDELYEGSGRDKRQVGWTKKVKFWDKTKAHELVGKYLTMFVDKREVNVRLSLEQLVKGSYALPSDKPEITLESLNSRTIDDPTPDPGENRGPQGDIPSTQPLLPPVEL